MTGPELATICDEVMARPDLQPTKMPDGTLITHCNQGARLVAQACGCTEFDDLSLDAEMMGQIMALNASGRWTLVVGDMAAVHAQMGGLAIAFMSAEALGEAHAHIDAVYPAPTQWSGSLGKMVPMLANVGCQDQEERESQAFPVAKGEPSYFIWNG